MSSETLTHEVDHTDHDEPAVGHKHPRDRQYVVVALILGLFTTIEVLTYFLDFGSAAVPTLLVLMVVKFAMVVLYFMHLRYERPSLFWSLVPALLVVLVLMDHFWPDALRLMHQRLPPP